MAVIKNAKWERFCIEYLIDANATQAYIRAGYSEKGAHRLAARLMANDGIRARIAELTAQRDRTLVAQADEVLQYLTAVMRGEYPDGSPVLEDVPMVVGTGKGKSRIQHTATQVNSRERTKAAELLGKRHGLFTDKVVLEAEPVTIINDIPRPQQEAQNEQSAE